MDKFFMIKGSWWAPFAVFLNVTLTRMWFETHIAGVEFLIIPALATVLLFLPGIIQYAFVWGYAIGGCASMSGWVPEGYLIGGLLASWVLSLAGWMKCKEILRNPGTLEPSSISHAKDTLGTLRAAVLVIPLAGWSTLAGWYLDFDHTYRMVLGISSVYSIAIMCLGLNFLSEIYEFSTGNTKEYVEHDYFPY